jgi:hypothetical protein
MSLRMHYPESTSHRQMSPTWGAKRTSTENSMHALLIMVHLVVVIAWLSSSANIPRNRH